MLTARPLSVWDAWFCWRLDRDAGVRDTAVDPTPPTLWKHVRWMCAWLFKRDRQAWTVRIAAEWWDLSYGQYVPASECPYELYSEPIALARVRRDGTVSVATMPTHRQRGAGLYGVRVATGYAEFHGWATPTATIRSDNGPSIGLFAKAGYEMIGAREGWVTMQRPAA